MKMDLDNKMVDTFLTIIKDYIFNNKSSIEIVDPVELCEIAEKHQLAPIIYY